MGFLACPIRYITPVRSPRTHRGRLSNLAKMANSASSTAWGRLVVGGALKDARDVERQGAIEVERFELAGATHGHPRAVLAYRSPSRSPRVASVRSGTSLQSCAFRTIAGKITQDEPYGRKADLDLLPSAMNRPARLDGDAISERAGRGSCRATVGMGSTGCRRTLRRVPTVDVRRITVAVLAIAAVLPAVAGAFPPAPSGVQQTRVRLERLTVAPAGTLAGYSRERFGGDWATTTNGCDVRERVLIRDGRDVQPGPGCKITTGRWRSVYDGAILTAGRSVDIDHVVPLAEAWRSGADTWNAERRERFANDLREPQLIAVSSSSNRSRATARPRNGSRRATRSGVCTRAGGPTSKRPTG